MNIGAEVLRSWAQRLLQAAGLELEVAAIVADHLVYANLRGVDSHGMMRLPIYIARLKAGLVNPKPRPQVLRTLGPWAVVDGDQGPGQVAGRFAMGLTMQLAKEYGLGAVWVQRSTHYGAAAYYVEPAAREGFVALSTTNAEPDMVPYGGARAALGTNPLAFAAPAPQGILLLDMATSQVAMGKIFLARERGETIPEGWVVDEEGRPTTDPGRAKAALPLGGPKGYGLAIMVEILSGVLSGAGFTHRIGRMYDEWDRPQDVGHFFLAIDPRRVLGWEVFQDRMGTLWTELKAVPPAPGFTEVLLPGELEERTRKQRLVEGIPLPEAVYTRLVETSRQLGVEVPE